MLAHWHPGMDMPPLSTKGAEGTAKPKRSGVTFLVRALSDEAKALYERPVRRCAAFGELTGLWRIKFRRFCIVYEPDRKARVIRILVIGHRREVYDELAEQLRQGR
jgi:mRNA-degrading endonuclease RelE of RelBE toxin-antitoxin system